MLLHFMMSRPKRSPKGTSMRTALLHNLAVQLQCPQLLLLQPYGRRRAQMLLSRPSTVTLDWPVELRTMIMIFR